MTSTHVHGLKDWSLQLETEHDLNATRLCIYEHSSGMRVLWVPTVPGPLISSTIIVPTLVESDHGLAHTLEHLIFCGSKSYPCRGYLDTLATRSLSMGTNAYTCEDYTAYTVVTAGGEGSLNILPVLLDHVLQPTLRESQFLTEVHHLDGHGKHQGVVYCEMASRENSEADLLDLAVRLRLCCLPFLKDVWAYRKKKGHAAEPCWQVLGTYGYECGGRTASIAELTNTDIVEYHLKYYRLDHVSIIVTGGDLDIRSMLDKLSSQKSVLEFCRQKRKPAVSKMTSSCLDAYPASNLPKLFDVPQTLRRSSPDGAEFKLNYHQHVRFPSSDESLGSMAWAWLGPPSEDFETVVAVDVLLRFLQETSASPLHQLFVERAEPLADDVDYELKLYVDTVMTLVMSGVPMPVSSDGNVASNCGSEEEGDGSSLEEDEDESEPEEDESDMGSDTDDSPVDNLIDMSTHESIHATFGRLLFDLLNKTFHGKHPLEVKGIHAVLHRYRMRLLESMEDDPHAVAAAFLVPDILSSHYRRSKHHRIGQRLDITKMLDHLKTKEAEYWIHLADVYLLNAPVVSVLMTPDRQLASDLELTEESATEQRQKQLGEEGWQQLARLAADAVEENKVNVDSTMRQSMPPIPSGSTLSKSQHDAYQVQMDASTPFASMQLVQTNTLFHHIRLSFNVHSVPPRLKPYLVLFQELLFQSDVRLRHKKDFDAVISYAVDAGYVPPAKYQRQELRMDYRALVKLLSVQLAHYESSIGFGNETFSCSWLSDVFMLSAQAADTIDADICRHLTPRGFNWASVSPKHTALISAVSWMLFVLFKSVFDRKRVMNLVQTMLSGITELKRDGGEMVSAVLTRVTSRARSETFDSQKLDNDLAMSVFVQESFLKEVLKKSISEDLFKEVLDSLNELRQLVVRSVQTLANDPDCKSPGFVQICLPVGSVKSSEDIQTLSDRVREMWTLFGVELELKSPTGSKRRKTVAPITRTMPAFPFYRIPYALPSTSKSSRHIQVALPGVTSCFLMQLVPCDLLSSAVAGQHTWEYAASILLTELLCRNEGPLYSAIRGRGFAYDSSISLYLWSGQMVFELVDASEPTKALQEWWTLVSKWKSGCWPVSGAKDEDVLFTHFDLETARSSCMYRLSAEMSTAGSVITQALHAALKGFDDIESFQNVSAYFSTSVEQLLEVFKKYFLQFLDPHRRITVLVTPSERPTESVYHPETGEIFHFHRVSSLNEFNVTVESFK